MYTTSGQQSSRTQAKKTNKQTLVQIIKEAVNVLHKSGEPTTLPYTT